MLKGFWSGAIKAAEYFTNELQVMSKILLEIKMLTENKPDSILSYI